MVTDATVCRLGEVVGNRWGHPQSNNASISPSCSLIYEHRNIVHWRLQLFANGDAKRWSRYLLKDSIAFPRTTLSRIVLWNWKRGIRLKGSQTKKWGPDPPHSSHCESTVRPPGSLRHYIWSARWPCCCLLGRHNCARKLKHRQL